VEAVRDGQFHVYPVKTIDEGIAILTGCDAGERREDGTYPEGTVNCLVNAQLEELAKKLREFARKNEEEKGENS